MKDDFVPRVEQSPQGKVKRFGYSNADQNLGVRVVTHPAPLLDILRNHLAQLRHAKVRCVSGFPFLHGKDGGFPDSPGRNVIGFADPERNDVGHRLNYFEKVSNPRARDLADMISNILGEIHGVKSSLELPAGELIPARNQKLALAWFLRRH